MHVTQARDGKFWIASHNFGKSREMDPEVAKWGHRNPPPPAVWQMERTTCQIFVEKTTAWNFLSRTGMM